MLVVVVYDIPDDKRRLKLANLLEGYGRRVQYSVFECFLSRNEMKHLYDVVAKLVQPDQGDNVRFYWIPKESVGKGLTLGSPLPQAPPDLYII